MKSILLSSFSKEELIVRRVCYEWLEEQAPEVPLGEEGFREIEFPLYNILSVFSTDKRV